MLVTNIISPYRIPLFNYLNSRREIDLKVVALAEKEENREWQLAKDQISFKYRILPGFHKFLWKKELPIHINWGLWQEFKKFNPDVVITSGYDTLPYWNAFLYAKILNKKYILWNGTTLLSVRKIDGIIGSIKRIIIKSADYYVTYGTKAAEYLEYMGAPKNRIIIGINTVDMDWYQKEVANIRKEKFFEKERSQYTNFLILYVGQLIKRKGVEQLIKALYKLDDPDIGLLIIGSGPQEDELKRFCRIYKLRNVYFEGFHQQKDLPYYYALSDILVLPSFKEVWGLVVNEALASGLYVLCSNQAGAAYDLIKEARNGLTFNPYNIDELTKKILETKKKIKSIKMRREAISYYACRNFGINKLAKAFLEAIQSII